MQRTPRLRLWSKPGIRGAGSLIRSVRRLLPVPCETDCPDCPCDCWPTGCGALIGARLFAPRSQDVRFIEVSLAEVASVNANHRQGSIGFTINGEDYFYYVGGSDDSERTIAVSALLADLQRASTIQVRSERYGLHRLVTNLLLFYPTFRGSGGVDSDFSGAVVNQSSG